MGFAVVADEVRALAQRSAKAAKETAEKIEGAINKTAQGVEISDKVGTALNDIVSKARQVDELAAEVAGASREQTQGITQINGAVGQMDLVTQHNAANAEESAAAAAELNAQAHVMQEAVRDLEQLCGLIAAEQPVPQAHTTESRNSPARHRAVRSSSSGHATGHSDRRSNGESKNSPTRLPAPSALPTARRSEIPMGGEFTEF